MMSFVYRQEVKTKYVLGFDIGGTKSIVLLVSPDKEYVVFLERKLIPTHGTWKEVLGCLADTGKAFLGTHRIPREKYCLGISCGGSLDGGRDVILSPPNLPGWDQVSVVSYLTQRLGMDARLKNDVGACTLAEWRYGAGKSCRHMIFLTFGTGLGAELILDGRLHEGARDMAREAGCVRPAEDGPVGYARTGSSEEFCNGGGIARLARSMAEDVLMTGRVVSYMKDGGLEGITARDVAKAVDMGYADARDVLAVSGRYFGRGLTMLVGILNPERTVARGIYARVGRSLKEEMEKELRREAFPANVNACCILSSGPGEQIEDYGTVMVAMEIWEEQGSYKVFADLVA